MSERERLSALLEEEFDLELLEKFHELEQIENELERGEELRNLVEKLILNGTVSSSAKETNPFGRIRLLQY